MAKESVFLVQQFANLMLQLGPCTYSMWPSTRTAAPRMLKCAWGSSLERKT